MTDESSGTKRKCCPKCGCGGFINVEVYAQGRTTPGKVVTWTMKSKHIDGNAVDLLPVTGWDNLASFKAVSKAMFQAASELGVKITWGADWNGNGIQEKGETDSPHFEISA